MLATHRALRKSLHIWIILDPPLFHVRMRIFVSSLAILKLSTTSAKYYFREKNNIITLIGYVYHGPWPYVI